MATILFQHYFNPLGHGVHQSFTGCHWNPFPLVLDNITMLPPPSVLGCSIGFWSGEMLSQSITFTLSFFKKAVVVLQVCLGSLSCWNTVSEERGSCSASDHAERHIQMLSLENRRRSASYSHCIKLVCMAVVPERKPLLKMMHKKGRKQFAVDKQTEEMYYWNHVLWSDETKVNFFGSDGVKGVWRQPGEEYKDKCVLPTVKHVGGSVMIWGCMRAAGTGELQLIEGTMIANMCCEIVKQSMIPSLRKLGGRARLRLCLLLAVSLCLNRLIIRVPNIISSKDYSCISIPPMRREIESSCQCPHHPLQRPTKVDDSRQQRLSPQRNREDSDQGLTSPKQGRQTGCERGSVPYRYSNHTGSIPHFTYFLMALEMFCLCS